MRLQPRRQPRNPWFSTLALGLTAILLVATGCGSDRTNAEATEATEATEASEATEATETSEAGQQESSFFGNLFSPQTEPRTVPVGTQVVVELDNTLSSAESQPGDTFQAHVTQDVVMDGVVVIPTGSTVFGEVTQAEGPKIGGRAKLTLAFRTLEVSSGDSVPFGADFAQVGKSERAKDAAIIGGSTIGGAILGEAVDEGEGTVVGAIVGGVAGALGAKKTEGKPLVLVDGTELTLQLTRPVTLEVEV